MTRRIIVTVLHRQTSRNVPLECDRVCQQSGVGDIVWGLLSFYPFMDVQRNAEKWINKKSCGFGALLGLVIGHFLQFGSFGE